MGWGLLGGGLVTGACRRVGPPGGPAEGTGRPGAVCGSPSGGQKGGGCDKCDKFLYILLTENKCSSLSNWMEFSPVGAK